ncbi:MAG: carboxypeptidase-like regulatory domain-containing protein, partial [Candidatus Curtissbacteria bacterium]|nr:carboxypeptidase-like regulatory domain-containing protein [Candidatus Curtissbacteria bacterium]
TVAAGDTTTNITFTIIDDPTPEASETVILTLSSPSNATVGTNNQYTLTITDTDLGGGGFGGQPPPPPPPPPPPEEPPPEETPPEELPPEEAPPEEIPPEEETPPEEVPPEEPPPEEAPPEEFVLPTEPSEPTPPSQPESTSSDGHIPSQPTTSPSSAVAPRPTIVEIIQSPAPTKEKIISVAKVVAKELPIIFAKAPQTIKHSAVIVKQISDDPKVEKITKQIIAPIIAGATLVALSPSFAAAAIPLSKFLFFQPLLFLGFIRRKHWGKIYNTLNKLPVDLATIRLIDAQTNKIVQSKVTDQYGHYGFFAVKPGIYRLEVFKKGFIYPSQLLQGQNVDGRLIDLYFNTKIIVDSQNPNIVFNIPLDPIEKTKKPSRINIQKNLRIIQNIFAGGGLLATFIYLLITNVWYLWLLLGFHLILYLLFLKFIAPKQPKGWGKVYDMTSDKRLNKTIVRLFSKQFNKLIDFHITDNKGRYAFLTGPGQYYVTFEKSGYFKHKMENDLRVKEKEEANLIKEDVRLIRVEVDGDADGMISVDHSPPADSAGGSG